MKITCTKEEKEFLIKSIVDSETCFLAPECSHFINIYCRDCIRNNIEWEIVKDDGLIMKQFTQKQWGLFNDMIWEIEEYQRDSDYTIPGYEPLGLPDSTNMNKAINNFLNSIGYESIK